MIMDQASLDDSLALASKSHVVVLVNFVAPNHLPVLQALAAHVDRLTVLSSVAVESNRAWTPDWADLDVTVQKTWTITRNVDHPGGYRDVNYLHIPLDTISQLRRLRPDAIVSLELGPRTMLAHAYQKANSSCALVAAVNASPRSEAGRGRLRGMIRRRLLPRLDAVTYNGPECREFLVSLGTPEERLHPWFYAADPRKHDVGDRVQSLDRDHLSLVTTGELSDRKGVFLALNQLADWAEANASRQLDWHLVGKGPQQSMIENFVTPDNLKVHLHGFCGPDEISEHYRSCDASLFPTLCDEWGLVVDESLFSGVPVIGSKHAQSVATLIRDGQNGFVYDPEVEGTLADTLDKFVNLSDPQLSALPASSRLSVAERTVEKSAQQIASAVSKAIADRRG